VGGSWRVRAAVGVVISEKSVVQRTNDTEERWAFGVVIQPLIDRQRADGEKAHQKH